MAIRIMDSIKTANDSTEFPVSFGGSIWLNKDKSGATEDYSDLQTMYNNDELGNGGSSIQVDTMPIASVDELGKIYEFIGSTGTYVNGYFYECVSDGEPTPTYSWVQKNVQPNAESFTFNEDDFNIDSSTDKVSLLPSRRVFNGSKADWDLLSVAEKTQYGATAFTDDDGDTRADVYSTTETLTNKVWIDGKPIYRRVVSFPNMDVTPNDWSTISSLSMTDIDQIIDARGKRSADNAIIAVSIRSVDFSSIQVSTATNFSISMLILEYTKTTD